LAHNWADVLISQYPIADRPFGLAERQGGGVVGDEALGELADHQADEGADRRRSPKPAALRCPPGMCSGWR